MTTAIDELVIEFVKANVSTDEYFSNRNLSKKIFWDNRVPELSNYVFNKYNEYNTFLNTPFSLFIRTVFLNEANLRRYKDIDDFVGKFKSIERLRFNEGIGKELEQDIKNLVDFEPRNPQEAIYCYKNGITKRPLCNNIGCHTETKYTTTKYGYRKFCSAKCQIENNNSLKEVKLSPLSDDEIRKVIEEINPSNRNLTNEKYADVYINVFNYSQHENDLSAPERLYLFLNELPTSHSFCVHCGDKKLFVSSVVGYKKTCGRNNCIHLTMRGESYYTEEFNFRRNRGKRPHDSGFLYLFKVPDRDVYKIGVTKNPRLRLKSLKKYIPNLEIVYCVYRSKNLTATEDELHKMFATQQYTFENTFGGYTEFFELNSEDIIIIREIMYEV